MDQNVVAIANVSHLTDEQLLALRDTTLEVSPLSHPEQDELSGAIEREMIRRFEDNITLS
jgi:hypothetical protein